MKSKRITINIPTDGISPFQIQGNISDPLMAEGMTRSLNLARAGISLLLQDEDKGQLQETDTGAEGKPVRGQFYFGMGCYQFQEFEHTRTSYLEAMQASVGRKVLPQKRIPQVLEELSRCQSQKREEKSVGVQDEIEDLTVKIWKCEMGLEEPVTSLHEYYFQRDRLAQRAGVSLAEAARARLTKFAAQDYASRSVEKEFQAAEKITSLVAVGTQTGLDEAVSIGEKFKIYIPLALASAYVARGQFYWKKDEREKAEKDFGRAVALDPWNQDCLLFFTVTAEKKDNDRQELLKRLRSLFKSEFIARRRFYLELFNPDKKPEDLNQAAELIYLVRHKYGFIDQGEEQVQLDTLIKMLSKAAGKCRLDGFAHLQMGVSYLAQNKRELAQQEFEKICQLVKDFKTIPPYADMKRQLALASFQLGKIHFDKADYQQAKDAYDQVERIIPGLDDCFNQSMLSEMAQNSQICEVKLQVKAGLEQAYQELHKQEDAREWAQQREEVLAKQLLFAVPDIKKTLTTSVDDAIRLCQDHLFDSQLTTSLSVERARLYRLLAQCYMKKIEQAQEQKSSEWSQLFLDNYIQAFSLEPARMRDTFDIFKAGRYQSSYTADMFESLMPGIKPSFCKNLETYNEKCGRPQEEEQITQAAECVYRAFREFFPLLETKKPDLKKVIKELNAAEAVCPLDPHAYAFKVQVHYELGELDKVIQYGDQFQEFFSKMKLDDIVGENLAHIVLFYSAIAHFKKEATFSALEMMMTVVRADSRGLCILPQVAADLEKLLHGHLSPELMKKRCFEHGKPYDLDMDVSILYQKIEFVHQKFLQEKQLTDQRQAKRRARKEQAREKYPVPTEEEENARNKKQQEIAEHKNREKAEKEKRDQERKEQEEREAAQKKAEEAQRKSDQKAAQQKKQQEKLEKQQVEEKAQKDLQKELELKQQEEARQAKKQAELKKQEEEKNSTLDPLPIAPIRLPAEAIYVLGKLGDSESAVIGGMVLNGLEGKFDNDDDVDIVTELTPEQVIALFPKGQIKVDQNKERLLHYYGGNRKVDIYCSSLLADKSKPLVDRWINDAKSRDFTCNTLRAKADGKVYAALSKAYKHAIEKKIKCADSSKKSLSEDPIRILRAIHAKNKRGYKISKLLLEEMPKKAHLLNDPKHEKDALYWLLKLLSQKKEIRDKNFQDLVSTGVLQGWLPGVNPDEVSVLQALIAKCKDAKSEDANSKDAKSEYAKKDVSGWLLKLFADKLKFHLGPKDNIKGYLTLLEEVVPDDIKFSWLFRMISSKEKGKHYFQQFSSMGVIEKLVPYVDHKTWDEVMFFLVHCNPVKAFVQGYDGHTDTQEYLSDFIKNNPRDNTRWAIQFMCLQAAREDYQKLGQTEICLLPEYVKLLLQQAQKENPIAVYGALLRLLTKQDDVVSLKNLRGLFYSGILGCFFPSFSKAELKIDNFFVEVVGMLKGLKTLCEVQAPSYAQHRNRLWHNKKHPAAVEEKAVQDVHVSSQQLSKAITPNS